MLTALAIIALQQGALPPSDWQQRADYVIRASLDETAGTLSGLQELHYTNNSPDTLRTISFHLYLNAFRPGSRWSDADSAEGVRRFNDLGEPDFAFNRIANVRIEGTPVTPIWPFAPDSTVVRFQLPRPLAPGAAVTVTMDWSARPSTLPRRQGRRGRHFDFAQWYPRVVAYDKLGWQEHPLYPAGEFYGDFGSFVLQLEVPSDQVIGATGVPVCGDPGWTRVDRTPSENAQRPPVQATQRPLNAFELAARNTGCRDQYPGGGGIKQVVWAADSVHHFAMTMSPDYIYEGGSWNGIAVHVLYQPGDTATWGNGVEVGHTINTLKWLDEIFGPYPWPQMTVVHRIEGGGTEFPMMQMNGSSSQELNLHEGAHNYLMGILASNEWREGWMDEGGASFIQAWYDETHGGASYYAGLESDILELDVDGWSEPTSLVSEQYRDFATYGAMIYGKGELFYRQLRHIVGDSTMRAIFRRYYQRYRLRHVDEAAFRAVAEEVSRRDLSAFFAQWLHSTDLYDFAVGKTSRRQVIDGWETTVEVLRLAPGQFPVTVAVYAEGDTAVTRASGVPERERLTLRTRTKPRKVRLDPGVNAHDWNMLNNERTLGLSIDRLIGRDQPTDTYLDTWFSQPTRRDARTQGWLPLVWYNDVGGVTIGARAREDYLGRFEQNMMVYSFGLDSSKAGDIHFRFRNPVWWRRPHTSQTLEGFRLEGRVGARLAIEHSKREHRTFGPVRRVGASLSWLATQDLEFLDPTRWENGGTAELASWMGYATTSRGWSLNFSSALVGGVQYGRPGDGIAAAERYDAQIFVRPEIEATARRSLGSSSTFAARLYGGAVIADDAALTQRRFFVQGAGPYETVNNPLVRSVGAPLVDGDLRGHVQMPGGSNLRGYSSDLSTEAVAALNVEVERRLLSRPGTPLLSRIDFVVFADVGVLGDVRGVAGPDEALILRLPVKRWLADAGFGLRFTHTIGETTWRTRLELPLWVSDAPWALSATADKVATNRWLLSFSPVIR